MSFICDSEVVADVVAFLASEAVGLVSSRFFETREDVAFGWTSLVSDFASSTSGIFSHFFEDVAFQRRSSSLLLHCLLSFLEWSPILRRGRCRFWFPSFFWWWSCRIRITNHMVEDDSHSYIRLFFCTHAPHNEQQTKGRRIQDSTCKNDGKQ
jgi:hypothetical protein